MGAFSKAVALAVLTGSLAGLCAGCGSPRQATEQNTVAPAASPPEHRVGDTVTVSEGGRRYNVTLVSVVDPARTASEYASPAAGHRLVAAQFRVTAQTAVDENSNASATMVGSDDQVYTPALEEVAEGTNFAHGSVRLQPGTSLVGWVPFSVPGQARAARVRWNPGAGRSARGAEWTVNTTTPPSPGPSPAGTPTGQGPSPAASPTAAAPVTDPEATVIGYFDAINNRDFRRAWELGGKNTASSYSSFADGFATTEWAGAEILDLSGDPGGGVVTARLTTLETDGTSKVFQGEYTVRNGVISDFRVHRVS